MKFLPRIKKAFNWMASPADRNYTLGEVFQHFAEKRPYETIRDNRLGFTNAGRMTERLHVAAGVLSAGLIIAGAPLSLTTLAIAGGTLGLYKVMGLAGGKLTDLAVSGRAYTPPTVPPRL
ncbi:MAG: hypothetical protein GC185_04545 [Alphaproteobacteria bacterium]|nr:hypothetical protein [Alphaproteobacteria bacterium]